MRKSLILLAVLAAAVAASVAGAATNDVRLARRLLDPREAYNG